MNFCDMLCKHAKFPKKASIDGSGTCRTFQALFCIKKNRLVHKNQPCMDKKIKKEELK